MQSSCPKCHRVLDYSGERPRFCAYCGQPLGETDLEGSDPRMLATAEFDSGSALNKPSWGPDTALSPGVVSNQADPEHVAGYKIVRLLGRGGMGSVYEAEDGELGRRVALKLIAAEHVTSDEAVERFRQEGRLASTLAHPRCVFVFGADEFQGRPYIVMELMPGETLQTLVEASGPLPIVDAIARTLDVIEGLQEAHLQGVVHRDVKPSNCFLEAGGRVKVGDFGLSKSLDSDAGLTRTGAFVGTPLYASPEQIKRDLVDERTDVYSVAATLYYLLAGKPPFEAGDAAAVLAKIVSEPPTPLRKHRPDVPPALEAAILRGLERDRDRRWQDLGRLRQALLPFMPGELRISDLALRAGAYVADVALLFAVEWLLLPPVLGLLGIAQADASGSTAETARRIGQATLWLLALNRLLFLVYFTITEGIWGASPAKRLAGLRVSLVKDGGPPGLRLGLLRAFVFFAVTSMPGDLISLLLFGLLPVRQAMLFQPVALGVRALGYLALTATMRASDNYRGLHEKLSGTRVVRLSRRARRRAPTGRRLPSRPDYAREFQPVPVGVLKSVGAFRVRGAVRWDSDRRVLMGEDSTLERPVWLVIRPKGSPAPPAARRDLARPSRPRWLAGGEQAEGRWDAYSAPTGCPLADLAGPQGLPWADARPILHDLADELSRACNDDTLPGALSPDQVWVQGDGSVLLADALGPTGVSELPPKARALELLHRSAVVALEGGRRRSSPAAKHGAKQAVSIRAAVPAHAGRMLDRLVGRPRAGDTPYTDPAEIVTDLEADADKPTEVDRLRRAVHLVPAAFAMAGPLILAFLATYPDGPYWPGPLGQVASGLGMRQADALEARNFSLAIVVALPIVWCLWAFLTRGGLLLGLAGVTLVRVDSRPAERWRCSWRSLVTWLPVAALLGLSCWARANGHHIATWVGWMLALGVVIVYPALALLWPARSVHDRLSGTWLVPE